MKTPPLWPLKRMKKLGEWLNSLREDVRRIEPMASHNVRVNRTTRGTSYIATAAVEEGRPGGFRGEWIITSAYEAGETVKVSHGLEAGVYIAVQAVPANEPQYFPWLGGRWVLFARVNDQSSWV